MRLHCQLNLLFEEVRHMTTGTKLHQTIGMLKSAAGNLQSFAMDTQDSQAKQMFTSCHKQLDQIVQQLNARTNYAEQQEPQYKMRNMAQSGQQQGMQTQRNQYGDQGFPGRQG